MKKMVIVASLLLTLNVVRGSDPEKDWVTERGYAGTNGADRVLINGVTWATRNIGIPGNFVFGPEEHGGIYEWRDAKSACPEGWRLPTKQDIEKLVVSGLRHYTLNGVEGALLGDYDMERGEYALLFLPYAGAGGPDGWGYEHRENGLFWSDTTDSERDVYYLNVCKTGMYIRAIASTVRHSVRCVLK